MVPMIAPKIVDALRMSNLSWKSSAPSVPPAYEPTMPSSTVPQKPSRDGLRTISRPIAPAMRPTKNNAIMAPSMATLCLWQWELQQAGPEPYLADRLAAAEHDGGGQFFQHRGGGRDGA